MTDPWVGKVLGGRYRLEALLGQGGMSSVYRATDPNLRRVVAIKLIHSHLSNQPEFVRRFEEEAAAVAQLRHPNIVQVYDFNHDGGLYYMVLENIQGETLQERLKRLNASGERLNFPEAMRYAAGVCEAVDYAHRRGTIHRDIKPANIMIDQNGQAILMDFGIAKIFGGGVHTATGAVVGTALYMSPEQIRGEPLDGRSDIYAIGVTLFEMVNGRPPFESDSAATLMMMHLTYAAPDTRKLRPGVPEGLAQIIERALSKDRDQRFATAAEMAAALRREAANVQAGALSGAALQDQAYQPTIRQNRDEVSAEIAAALGSRTPEPAKPPSGQNAAGGTPASSAAAPGAERAGTPPGGTPAGRTGYGVQPGVSTSQTLGIPANRRLVLAGGCAMLTALLICILGGAGLFINRDWFNNSNAVAMQTIIAITQTSQHQTAIALGATNTPAFLPSLTHTPTATSTEAPSATFTPAPPTNTPDTVAVSSVVTSPLAETGPYVFIVSLQVEGDHYVITYETVGFVERKGARHIHFFFDSDMMHQAGSDPNYIMYSGPRPYRGLMLIDTPPEATRLCALTANPDHSVIPDSGNCVDLPAQPTATPSAANAIAPTATDKPDKKEPKY
jgi:serine/threonine protein kinase